MKIYKYGKMTYPIRECPHCGCVFSFYQTLAHSGGVDAEGETRYLIPCPDCLKMFRVEKYDLIKWDRKLPDSID